MPVFRNVPLTSQRELRSHFDGYTYNEKSMDDFCLEMGCLTASDSTPDEIELDDETRLVRIHFLSDDDDDDDDDYEVVRHETYLGGGRVCVWQKDATPYIRPTKNSDDTEYILYSSLPPLPPHLVSRLSEFWQEHNVDFNSERDFRHALANGFDVPMSLSMSASYLWAVWIEDGRHTRSDVYYGDGKVKRYNHITGEVSTHAIYSQE